MRWVVTVLIVAAPLSPVRAADNVWSHHFAAELHLAVGFADLVDYRGGPFGNLGGAIDVSIAPWLAVAVGAGLAPGGLQWSVSPRLRSISEHWAFDLGVGISGGYYDDHSVFGNSGPARVWDPAVWVDFETGFEHRWSSGFLLRVYAGLARMLNPDGFDREGLPPGPFAQGDAPLRFYVGVAVGGFGGP